MDSTRKFKDSVQMEPPACSAKSWIQEDAEKDRGSGDGLEIHCLPGWTRHYKGLAAALPDINP
jgi:hypothetical protein